MSNHKQDKLIDKCFRNKQGNILLWQKPNLPLYLWVISFILLSIFNYVNITGKLINILELLKFGFIFVWAWLELLEGENYFRKFLGLTIIIIVIVGKTSG